MEKCKYCGTICKDLKGLATHRRYNKECYILWEKEQNTINDSKTYVYCEICGAKLRNISNTHLKKHNITQQEYKKLYPNSPIFAEGLLDLQKNNREDTITERYTNNNINIRDSNSLDYFIRVYGDNTDAREKYKERCKSIGYKSSRQYFIDLYGEYEGNKLFEERMNNIVYAQSLEGLIERFGDEEGKKIFESRKELSSFYRSKEYLIERHGEIGYEEICASKAQTLENYIKKYGVETGEARFIEYKSKCLTKNFHSKLADELFEEILSLLNIDRHKNIHFAVKDEEYGMILPQSKKYTYFDFYDTRTNKIIEFYGDYWHCNPLKYKEDDIIHYPNKVTMTAKEVWNKDKLRIDEIKEYRNADILIIWESDLLENREGCIQKCLTFLNE